MPVRRRVTTSALVAAGVLAATLTASPVHGEIRQVNADGSLQAALDAAKPGDVIVLQAGAVFTGNFQLPAKPSGPPITIRSSGTLPERRVSPADAGAMATIFSGNGASALTGQGSANWIIDGVRFLPNVDGHGDVIGLQDVTNITLDRILLQVPDGQQQKRGIKGNGRHVTLTRSYISGVWRSGQDSQAFCAWDGAGPYIITDNYLEAASENVMFGGANSGAADRVPSDILVEHNHFSKPVAWKGQPRAVKNLFELKAARRVVIRNNLFEHNWTDAQSGWAIVFTARNDEGNAPWSVVEDVVFEYNIVRDTENGINVLGYDSYAPSGRTTRITIRHNLVVASDKFLQVGGEVGELTLDHNTVDQKGTFAIFYKGDVWPMGAPGPRPAAYAAERFTMTNTLANHGPYGLFGEESGIGTPALDGLTRSYVWTHNVLAGESGWGQKYPSVTWQPALAEHKAQFNSDYSLVATSVYRNAATDGLDLGALPSTGSTTPPPAPAPPPPPTEVCGDGVDNDGDGQTDEDCAPPPTEVCGDGVDNDGDGQVDEGCVATPSDTTGPSVTLWNLQQSKNHLKFKVQADDPSGIAEIRVEFAGKVVAHGTSSPLNVTIPLRPVAPGAYELRVIVTDGAGNTTLKTQTILN